MLDYQSEIPPSAVSYASGLGGNMQDLLQGVVVTDEPMQWVRGHGRVEGDWLERIGAELYVPARDGTSSLLFDLVSLHHPADAIPFIRKHGLLWNGPGDDEHKEYWPDWESMATRLRGILRLHQLLQDAVAGRTKAMKALRETWTLAHKNTGTWKDDVILERVSGVIARHINDGLKGVEWRVFTPSTTFIIETTESKTDGHRLGSPGAFTLAARTPNLAAFVFYELAHIVVSRVAISTCANPNCGRMFVLEDPRQQYCSRSCGARARYHRWARHRRSKEGGDRS